MLRASSDVMPATTDLWSCGSIPRMLGGKTGKLPQQRACAVVDAVVRMRLVPSAYGVAAVAEYSLRPSSFKLSASPGSHPLKLQLVEPSSPTASMESGSSGSSPGASPVSRHASSLGSPADSPGDGGQHRAVRSDETEGYQAETPDDIGTLQQQQGEEGTQEGGQQQQQQRGAPVHIRLVAGAEKGGKRVFAVSSYDLAGELAPPPATSEPQHGPETPGEASEQGEGNCGGGPSEEREHRSSLTEEDDIHIT